MAEFSFRAFVANTGDPIEVEVFVAQQSHGWTPREPNQYLEVKTDQEGVHSWFAMKWNLRIAHGQSEGGEIVIEVIDPTKQKMDVSSLSGD